MNPTFSCSYLELQQEREAEELQWKVAFHCRQKAWLAKPDPDMMSLALLKFDEKIK